MRVGARDERLVHADVRVLVPAESSRAASSGNSILAVGPHQTSSGAGPPEARLAHCRRRAARGATEGPSLLKRVASLKAAAAR